MRGRNARHMRNQRVERGAALRLIEARHGFAVAGVRAEPVDRLGRKCDETAAR